MGLRCGVRGRRYGEGEGRGGEEEEEEDPSVWRYQVTYAT